ncbi:MAG TPA: hypothetical protein VHZ53_07285 [Steroidobacteraceae bacterium]|jgi:hypothetical protein|nr:hypothetical protein [Steroidobacteraceae bacterium]
MRNPDRWQLPERPSGPGRPSDGARRLPAGPGASDGQGPAADSRRGALIGLIIVLLLIAGGLKLSGVLKGMADLQDCALSGRSGCQ